jgi:hypothetical protein
MADVVVKISPETYKNFALKEKGRNVLFVKLKKALYGTLCAALLFWKKLTEVLQGWGFQMNPYDQCAANKVIDGSQCMLSHHSSKVVDMMVSKMEA